MKLSLTVILLPAVVLALPVVKFTGDASSTTGIDLRQDMSTLVDLTSRSVNPNTAHSDPELLRATDRLAFEVPPSEFEVKRKQQTPQSLDWQSSGCHVRDVDFNSHNTAANRNLACDRWNFTVRNHKIQGRWTADAEKRALDTLARDLQAECEAPGVASWPSCIDVFPPPPSRRLY